MIVNMILLDWIHIYVWKQTMWLFMAKMAHQMLIWYWLQCQHAIMRHLQLYANLRLTSIIIWQITCHGIGSSLFPSLYWTLVLTLRVRSHTFIMPTRKHCGCSSVNNNRFWHRCFWALTKSILTLIFCLLVMLSLRKDTLSTKPSLQPYWTPITFHYLLKCTCSLLQFTSSMIELTVSLMEFCRMWEECMA